MLEPIEVSSIKRKMKTTPQKTPAKVISITSGKGGVGKTNTTVNLGLALAKSGKKVLLLDGDLGLANINILLGFKPGKTLQQVVNGEASISEVIVKDPLGIDIIPAASGIPELTNLSESERLQLIAAFDEFADCYDYMLVDTAAGIGDNVIYFNAAAEEILVVIDTEPTSITDAYALIKVLNSKHGRREFNIIVNRVPVGNDGKAAFSQLAAVSDRFLNAKLHFAGTIEDDEQLPEAVIKQRPFLQIYPNARASRDITRIAKKIASADNQRTPRGGLQFFFRALLEAETENH